MPGLCRDKISAPASLTSCPCRHCHWRGDSSISACNSDYYDCRKELAHVCGRCCVSHVAQKGLICHFPASNPWGRHEKWLVGWTHFIFQVGNELRAHTHTHTHSTYIYHLPKKDRVFHKNPKSNIGYRYYTLHRRHRLQLSQRKCPSLPLSLLYEYYLLCVQYMMMTYDESRWL